MNHSIDELVAQLHYDPTDSAAFLSLRAHYREVQDHASLCNLLETWATHGQDDVAAGQAFYEAATLVLEQLRDAGRSMNLLEQALERNPAHFEAAEKLQELYDQHGQEEKLAAVLSRRVELIEQVRLSPRVVAEVYYQIGQVWEKRFGNVEAALAHYQRSFEVDPTFVTGIYAARIHYEQQGNTRAALTLYDLEASVEPDAVRKAALLRTSATLRLGEGDIEGAADALRNALALVPGDLSLMHELSSVLLRKAERGGVSESALAERRYAAELLFQLAHHTAHQADATGGLAYTLQCITTALDADPTHAGALHLYEQCVVGTDAEGDLPYRWIQFLQLAPAHPLGARIRFQLAQVYVGSGQFDDAIQCLEPLFHQGDSEAARILVDLYARQGRRTDSSKALDVVLRNLAPAERVVRLRRIFHSYVHRGDVLAAVPIAKEIFDQEPGDAEALVFLEDHYRREGLHADLRDLLLAASRAPGLSNEAKKLRLREVAALSETVLGDLPSAAGAWRAILVVDPADVDAAHHLKRVLSVAGRWDDLLQILERDAVTTADNQSRALLLLDIAHIYLYQKSDPPMAIDAFRKAYAISPAREEIYRGLVHALLAANALDEAVVMLRSRAKMERGAARASVLIFLAEVLDERLQDYDEAYRICQEALQEDPSSDDAWYRMQQINERLGNYPRLLEVMSERARLASGESQSALFCGMAYVAHHHLGDIDRAFNYYAESLFWSASIRDTLEEMYGLAQEFEKLDLFLELLQARVANITFTPNRREVYRALARLYTQHWHDEPRAAATWENVVAIEDDEEALRALRAFYASQEDHDSLVAVLHRLAYFAADALEQRDLVLERAQVLAERLGRKKEAISVLQDLVQEPDRVHVPALFYLASLCESESNHEALVDVLQKERAVSDDPALQLRATQRIAELYQHHIGEDELAMDELFRWSHMDPNDPEPYRRLLVLLEFNGRYADLVRCIDALVDLEPDEAVVSALELRAAEVSIHALGDVLGGWKRLEELVRDGSEKAEQRLREFAFETGKSREFAMFMEELSERASSPATKAERRLHAARVYQDSLGDAEAAMTQVLLASEANPTDSEVLKEAEEIARKSGRWEDLLTVYERARAAASDDRGRLDPILKATETALYAQSDTARAAYLMAQAVALGVRTPSLMDYIEEQVLSFSSSRTEGGRKAYKLLVEVYRTLATDKDMEPEFGAELLYRAARLSLSALGDAAAAVPLARQAVELAGRETRYLDLWQQLVDVTGDWGAFEVDLQRLAKEALDPNITAELLRRRSDVLIDRFERFSAAADDLQKLLKLRPSDDHAADKLIQCLSKTERHQDLLVEAHRQLEKTTDIDRRASVWRQVARTWDQGLRNTREAKKAWEQVLGLVAGDDEAQRAVARLQEDLRNARAQNDSGFLGLPPAREIDRETEQELDEDPASGSLDDESLGASVD